MSLAHHSTKIITSRLTRRQIAYVTDNLRDAEALTQTVDSPVIIRIQESEGTFASLPPAFRSEVQTSRRSRSSDASGNSKPR